MSSTKNNQIFKKTSFLAGNNSSFIEEYYSKYLLSPELVPEDWKLFFEGLNEDKDIISKNLKGPSWSKKKILESKIKKVKEKKLKISNKQEVNISDAENTAKNSVRAIMLIRAYRIRGHLIADLDPLGLQQKKEHPELKPETYGFTKKDYSKKIFLERQHLL